MDRSLKWRTIGLVGLIVFCICTLLPSFVPDPEDNLPSWFRKGFSRKINYGLDLQGGLHVVYSLDLERAVGDKADEIKRDLDLKFGEGEWKDKVQITSPKSGVLAVKPTDAKKSAEVEGIVLGDYKDTIEKSACPPDTDKSAICFAVKSSFAESIRKDALHNAVLTIRDRIDEKGIAEPSVVEKGDDIIVELPGLDPDQTNAVRGLIARTAKLEFKIAMDGEPFMQKVYAFAKSDPNAKTDDITAETDTWHPEESATQRRDYYLYAHDQDRAITVEKAKEIGCWSKKLKPENGLVRCPSGVPGKVILDDYLKELAKKDPAQFKLPDGRQIGFEKVTPQPSAKDKRPYWRTWYLDKAVRLAGSAVTRAQVGWDSSTNKPIVQVEFNRYGGHVFGDLTSQNVGRRMAIILDDNVNSAPVINGPIRGGTCQITMGGNDATHMENEAKDLVAVLKTGSLPAPLKEGLVAEVGPTLGSDAIKKAELSFIVGIVLVVVIMLGIYRWSGFGAIGAVTINVLLMMTAMTWFGATLTLPGIAALVLTIGMGVDGNILIYERIRDELTLGKSVRGAVDVGFSRAFTAILDGHMTTAAGGWVLLQYGSGPIKGFAVMLLVGIGTTLFCSTVVTRIFFDWVVSRKKGTSTLSI